MSESFFPYQWTGDPWVDNSIRTLLALRSQESVIPQKRIRAPEEISLDDLRLLMEKYPLDQINALCNSYPMMFTNNGPLHQQANRNRSDATGFPLNRSLYRNKIHGWSEQLQSDRIEGSELCEVCGQTTKALLPEQKMDRSWFPLGGTLGSEAQAFPGGRYPSKVCLSCLLALQFLPLGVRLYRGKILLAESNSQKLCQKIVAANVKDNLNRFHADNPESPGKGESPLKTLEFLLEKIAEIADSDENKTITLCLWHASNSTQEASCDRTEIPNRVLLFLAKIWSKYSDDFKLLLRQPGKQADLLAAMVEVRDFPALYPGKQWPGVSEAFYRTYQQEILGFSPDELQLYQGVALLLRAFADASEQKMLAKTDAAEKQFVAYQTAVRRILKYATSQGVWSVALHAFFYATSLDTFPLQNNRHAKEIYKRVHFYYLKSLATDPTQTGSEPPSEPKSKTRKTKKNQTVDDIPSPETQQHRQQAQALFSAISPVLSWDHHLPGVSVLEGLAALFCMRFGDKLADVRNSWSHQKSGLCPISTLHSLFCWPDLRNPLLAEHWYTWLWQQDQSRLYAWPLLELLTIFLHHPQSAMTAQQAENTLHSWCPGDVFVGESVMIEEQLAPVQTFCQILLDRFVDRRGSLGSFEREQLRDFRTKNRSLQHTVDTWFEILKAFAQEQSLALPTKEDILGPSEDSVDLVERKKFFLLSLCGLYRERHRQETSSVLQGNSDVLEYKANHASQDA